MAANEVKREEQIEVQKMEIYDYDEKGNPIGINYFNYAWGAACVLKDIYQKAAQESDD